MFSDMLNQLGEKVSFILLRTVIQNKDADTVENQAPRHKNVQAIHESTDAFGREPAPVAEKSTPFQYNKGTVDPTNPNTWGKIARNDMCPCGSGKKYKHCHGQV